MRAFSIPLLAAATALLLAGTAQASTLILGATVYDGSGAPGRQVAVRYDGDRIVAEIGRAHV